MADNINVTPGTGSTVAADDIGGILHQRIKLVIGADGVSNGDVSSTNPMPVTGTFFQATQPVSGTVAVSNFPATQAVTGTFFQATQPVSNVVETASTGTITSVASATASFTVLAANANRKGFIIVNDSTATVFVAFAATASSTAFTLRLTANQSYFSTQLPIYRGVISAISSAATGNLRITELT